MSIPRIDKVIYTGAVRTTGGREGGASRSSDGRLDIRLSVPGLPGTGTNPEQLLAAGWSACYFSAIKFLAGQKKIRLPADAAVDSEVDLGNTDGQYFLRARLTVVLPGVDPNVARQLAEAAHLQCPYSKATHGNIEVVTTIKTDPVASMA
jgi:lipoyl-dependent peroxiredoxin